MDLQATKGRVYGNYMLNKQLLQVAHWHLQQFNDSTQVVAHGEVPYLTGGQSPCEVDD